MIRYLALALTVVFAATAPRAWGQNALDNSLQRGSGGTNTSAKKPRPGARQDAIVTGNVGGLEAFHGNIDYRAPGEFAGRTSADDNYNFRLHSLPPTGQAYQNYQGPNLLPRTNAGSTYLLRPGSGVTSGEVTGQYERFGGGTVRRDDATYLSARPSPDRALQNARLDQLSLDQAAVREQSIAIRTDDQGSLYEIVASPLMGVRQRQVGKALQLRRDNAQAEPGNPTQAQEPVNNQQARRIDDSVMPLSILLGERLTPLAGKGGTGAVERYRYTTADLAQAVLRPGDSFSVQPGTDVYYDLLNKVRGPGKEEPYRAIQSDRLGEKPKPTRPPARSQRPSEAAPREELGQNQPAEGEKAAFDRLVGKLKYDVTLKTLASGSGTPFDKALAGAESLMSHGRYFEAEEAYGQAMGRPGATPLAAVGRAHAELGAGLYVASGQNLRAVLERHPELIAARYEPPVLPGFDRLAEIRGELEELSKKETKEPEIAFVLTYVAYQRGDSEGVTKGLAAMNERSPDDPLVPLLQKLWTESRPKQPGEGADRSKAPEPEK